MTTPKYQVLQLAEFLETTALFYQEEGITSQFISRFPIVNNKVCSLIPGDVARSFTIQDTTYGACTLKQLQSVIAIWKEAYKKVASKTLTGFNKDAVCKTIYILQHIQVADNQTAYDQLMEVDIGMVPEPFLTFLGNIVKAAHDSLQFDEFVKALIQAGVDIRDPVLDARKKERMEILATKDPREWTFPLSEFFIMPSTSSTQTSISILSDLQAALQAAGPAGPLDPNIKSILEKIHRFMTDNGLLSTTNNSVRQNWNDMLSQLQKLSPLLCTQTPVDEDDRLYKEYAFYELGEFIHMTKGYCYTLRHLAGMILSNRGFVNLTSVTFLNPDTHEAAEQQLLTQIPRDLARYFSKDENKSTQRWDLFPILKTYSDTELDVLTNLLQNAENLKNLKTDIAKTPMPKYMIDGIDRKELELLFSVLIRNSKTLQKKNVFTIFEHSHMAVLELIGLCGYTCFSDFIIGLEDSKVTFPTAAICLGILKDTIEQLDYKVIEKIQFNNNSIQDILKMAPETCIHGVGGMFLKFYLSAYEIIASNAAELKSELQKTYKFTDTDEADEYIEQMLQVAPFIVPLDPSIRGVTNIAYVICTGDDYETFQQASQPVFQRLVITGFTSDLKHMSNIGYFMCENICKMNESLYTWKSKSFYIPYNFENDGICKNKKALMEYLCDKTNSRLLHSIFRIPYIFQRQRVTRFRAFANYTVSFTQALRSGDKSLSRGVANVNIPDRNIPPKYIFYLNKSNASKSLLNTSKNEFKQANFLKYNLHDILSLNYTKDGDKLVVQNSFDRKDITRPFQYMQFVGDVLNVPRNQRIMNLSTLSCEDQYALYDHFFRNACGQDNTFRTLFNNIQYIVYFQKIPNPNDPNTSQYKLLLPNDRKNHSLEDDSIKTFVLSKQRLYNPTYVNAFKQCLESFTTDPNTPNSRHWLELLDIVNAISSIHTINIHSVLQKVIQIQIRTRQGKGFDQYVFIKDFLNQLLPIMRFIMYFFYAFFIKFQPAMFDLSSKMIVEMLPNINMSKEDAYIKNRYAFYERDYILTLCQNYQLMIQAIPMMVCAEGYLPGMNSYNFVDLDRDYYLLEHIQRQLLRKQGMAEHYNNLFTNTLDDPKLKELINAIISVLNDIFYVYKDSDHKLLEWKDAWNTNNDEDLIEKQRCLQESVPLACEYLTKCKLLDVYTSRSYVFSTFCRLVNKCVTDTPAHILTELLFFQHNMEDGRQVLCKEKDLGRKSVLDDFTDFVLFHQYINTEWIRPQNYWRERRNQNYFEKFEKLIEVLETESIQEGGSKHKYRSRSAASRSTASTKKHVTRSAKTHATPKHVHKL